MCPNKRSRRIRRTAPKAHLRFAFYSMLNQLLVYSFVTLMSIVDADDFVLLLWNNVPRRNPVSRTNPNIFKSITAARGQVRVSSGTCTRLVKVPGYPGIRTTHKAVFGHKSGHAQTRAEPNYGENNGIDLVAIARRL